MDKNNLKLKRTDSKLVSSYKNKLCIIMSPLKMIEKIKLIEDDLKLKLKNINK